MRNPNGYGSVVKLSGNRRKPYCVRKAVTQWNEKGYPVYEVIGYYRNRKEALQALADFNADPYDLSQKEKTFNEIYELWSEKHYETVSAAVANQYRLAYQRLKPLYDYPMSQLKITQLQNVIDNADLNPQNKKMMLFIIKMMYKYAMMNEIVKKDLSQYLTCPQYVQKKERTFFTEDEINTLWNNLDVPYVKDVLIMIYSGWRATEYCELRTENIDLKEGIMKGGGKTEAGKNRIVPIHHRIKPLIESKYDENSEFLTNIKYQMLRDHFKAIMAGLHMTHTLHETRHTFVTRLDDAGANPTSIKRLAGHACRDVTTKTYTHKSIEQLRKAVELLP
jgi:integrase